MGPPAESVNMGTGNTGCVGRGIVSKDEPRREDTTEDLIVWLGKGPSHSTAAFNYLMMKARDDDRQEVLDKIHSQLMKDGNKVAMRHWLIKALHDLKDPSSLPIAEKMLNDGNPKIKSLAIWSLETIDTEQRNKDKVMKWIRSTNDDVRNRALDLACKWKVKEIIPILIKDVRAKKRSVRRQALNQLSHWKAEAVEAAPTVLALFGHSYKKITSDNDLSLAIYTLGELGDRSAIPVIEHYLSDPLGYESAEAALKKFGVDRSDHPDLTRLKQEARDKLDREIEERDEHERWLGH